MGSLHLTKSHSIQQKYKIKKKIGKKEFVWIAHLMTKTILTIIVTGY